MVILFILGFLFLLIQKNFFESNISIPLLQGIINWNNDKYGNVRGLFDLYPEPTTVLNFINVLFANTIKALKIQFYL
jgi:hypothetical protein